MICIESYEQTEARIDAMLREMVVEEGLAAMDTGCLLYTSDAADE